MVRVDQTGIDGEAVLDLGRVGDGGAVDLVAYRWPGLRGGNRTDAVTKRRREAWKLSR
jgi:hypothetical protein